jgi:hypothetical protein
LERIKRWWRGWRSAAEAELAIERSEISARLDAALAQCRDRVETGDEEMEALGRRFARLYELVSRRNGTGGNTRFELGDRVDFYAMALKLAAIGHPDHDAWPARAAIRPVVLEGLSARVNEQDDPWLRLCAVTAALAAGSAERAAESYEAIASDPFLAGLARRWANHVLLSHPGVNPRASYERFLELLGGKDPWHAQANVGPEHRWVLLASVFPDLSFDPRTTLRDARPLAAQRVKLRRDWGIVDTESAHSELDWLGEDGHRAQVAADLAEPDSERPDQVAFVCENRDALERHHALAWDLGRMVAVARSAYTVGYIDGGCLEETLDACARAMRETYSSWSDYGDDYVLGRRYFSPTDASTCPHVAGVRWLRDDPRSPWRYVPFGGGPDHH